MKDRPLSVHHRSVSYHEGPLWFCNWKKNKHVNVSHEWKQSRRLKSRLKIHNNNNNTNETLTKH
jgi:hypothetical protein